MFGGTFIFSVFYSSAPFFYNKLIFCSSSFHCLGLKRWPQICYAVRFSEQK